MFQPQLWPDGEEYWGGPFRPRTVKEQDVTEVWFSGVHGDVGGGYPEERQPAGQNSPALDDYSETKKLGLKYKTRTINEIVLGKNDKLDYVQPEQRPRAMNR